MKKLLSLLIALSMVFSLTACASDSASSVKDDDDETGAKQEVTFEATTLVDKEDFSFTVNSIKCSKRGTYTVAYTAKNASDQVLWFDSYYFAANNCMLDACFLDVRLDPGSSESDSLEIESKHLQELNIEQIFQLQFLLRVSDDEGDSLFADIFELYPYGEDAYTPEEYTVSETDTVLEDNSEFRVICTEYDPDHQLHDENCAAIFLRIENKTDSILSISSHYAYVNQCKVEAFWEESILPGSHAIAAAYVYEPQLERYGIETISQLCLNVSYYYQSKDLAYDEGDSAYYNFYPLGEDQVEPYQRQPRPEEAILADNDDFAIIYYPQDSSHSLQDTLLFYLENKTDKDIYIDLSDFAINDYYIDASGYAFLPAGAKSIEEIYVETEALVQSGITNMGKLTFVANICEEDTFRELDFSSYEYFPQGEENYVPDTYVPSSDHITVIDDENCLLVITDVIYDENTEGWIFTLYGENYSSDMLEFALKNATVDGMAWEPFWFNYAAPGTRILASLALSSWELNEEDVEADEFSSATMEFSYMLDYTSEPVDTATVTVPLSE